MKDEFIRYLKTTKVTPQYLSIIQYVTVASFAYFFEASGAILVALIFLSVDVGLFYYLKKRGLLGLVIGGSDA